MMVWTDRHCRFFHRLLSRHVLLYSEMVTTGALIHGDIPRHLVFNPEEQPVALQLGGSEPVELAQCARLGEEWGYREINLNCGCPSERVQRGSFGACLMAEPQLVADCVKAMVDAVGIPVLSKGEDIANARLRFANGCVANLTASRVSAERLRKIRVFSGGANTSYVSLDYRAQEGFIYRIAREGEEESSLLKKLLHASNSAIVSEFGGKKIVREPVPIEKDEPLKLELQSFIRCVRDQATPIVSGESAKRALDLAVEITRQIHAGGTTL